jgi:UDP-glucose 4-epimerase
MRIFITGGAGFIGTHLCQKLAQTHDVTIYDNFSNSNQENSLSTTQSVSIISGDILDYQKLSSAMKNHNIVIHLAAKIDVINSIINPELTFETNVKGTQNVLDSCVLNGITKIIATSSAAIYQNVSKGSITEENKTEPLSPYGKSKLEMEKIITNSKIDSTILRLFNVYGSNSTSGVIVNFKENIQNNKQLTIFGDGKAIRDFVHVDDVIHGIVLSISSKSGIFNIASGTGTSINDLAKLFIHLSEKKSEIIFKPARDDEIIHSVADISLAQKELGFFPQISLNDGLKTIFP